MGLFDKVKGMLGSNADKIEDAVEDGINKAADMAKGIVPDEHDDKVDMADKIDGGDDGGEEWPTP